MRVREKRSRKHQVKNHFLQQCKAPSQKLFPHNLTIVDHLNYYYSPTTESAPLSLYNNQQIMKNARAFPSSLLLLLFCSANAFSLNGRTSVQITTSKDNILCHSSLSLDDDRMPTGPFSGITTRVDPATAADFSLLQAQTQTFDFGFDPSPLIPISSRKPTLAASSFYNIDLDLPSTSRTSNGSLLAAIELNLSRIAMIAALGLFAVEITTGASVPDQIVRLVLG